MNILSLNRQRPVLRSLVILGIISVVFFVGMLFKDRGSLVFSGIYLIMLTALVIISITNPDNNLSENLFKYRWLLSGILFISLVAFEVSGSSIGMYSEYLNGSPSEYTIYGEARAIRTDEWSISTPMVLSQYSNGFPYFSNIVRATETDMFIVYGQPVLNIAVLFRPFHWGYLFLSAGRGLSFFWFGRLIALFMVTLEFSLFLTNKNKALSAGTALLVTFAPVVQWWFAINGLIEMLVFGQLAVLLIDKYMNTQSIKLRLLFAAFFAFCAGGYLLTFYPSWMIPLFYVFLGLALWVIMKNFKRNLFSKQDLASLALFLLIFGGGMAYILYHSYPTIETVMNTSYPGSRSETGGGMFTTMFQYIMNLFLPGKDILNYANNCEVSVFFDLFPLGILLALLVLFVQRNLDKLLIILIIVAAFLGIYCCAGFPEWLAKITLLSNSQSSRCIMAFGFVNILILIRALSLLEVRLKTPLAAVISSLTAAVNVLITVNNYRYYYDTLLMIVISFAVLFASYMVVLLIHLKPLRKMFVPGCVALALIMGASVNPLEKGVYALTNTELYQAIVDITVKDNGLWIVEDLSFVECNIPMTAKAPTINSTNVYPALERWAKLDEAGEYSDLYNRYAHIQITLTDSQDTTFEISSADQLVVTLNITQLSLLDVKYIMTKNDLTKFNRKDMVFESLGNYNGYSIYQIIYY